MATSTLMGWTIPTETVDPWYTAFVALVNQIDADVAAVEPAVSIMQFWNGTVVVPVNTSTFLGRGHGAEFSVRFMSPIAGTIQRMMTIADSAPGGVQTYIYTVRVSGVDSALTATVASANSASNTVGSVSVIVGDQITIHLVTSLTAVAANHMVTLAIKATG